MNGIIISFTQFKEVDFIIRSPHSHKQHCLELEHNTNASKEYGINRNSCLNELRYNLNGFKYTLTQFCDLVVCRYFHVCDGGLVPDVMHDLLEGAMQYEVKLMLKKMFEIDKYFSHGKQL